MTMKASKTLKIVWALSKILAAYLLIMQAGCTATKYRQDADESAQRIIADARKDLFGSGQGVDIERPADILRRRLLLEQDLPYADDASLGTDALAPIAHNPEQDYPKASDVVTTSEYSIEDDSPLVLSLVQALEVGAANTAEYQSKKEKVFQAALDLDLQRSNFGFVFGGDLKSQIEKTGSDSGMDGTGEDSATLTNSGSLSANKAFKNGASFAAYVGIDLVNLLTGGHTFSKNVTGDASISIPLLRGAGKHIASEALTQAQRDLVYTLYELERYKRAFAVDVVSNYLEVLQQGDQVENALENYKTLMTSALRTKRMEEVGRAEIIQVDQAAQAELSARNQWISAAEAYENRLDAFKTFIGLPADAQIELSRSELETLAGGPMKAMMNAEAYADAAGTSGPAPPGMENAGPMEMGESKAIALAFENRLDLRIAKGRIRDAQRAVVIAADRLGAELTLFGEMQSGQSGGNDSYKGLITLDLPFERTAERNAYRNSYIALEQAVRNEQILEDSIKIAIRQNLRRMTEAREALKIQSRAVSLAEKRVKSTDRFYEFGRADLRDVLDAQSALLIARNALTSTVVDYRVAELAFQRDAGILNINDKGLLVEYTDSNREIQLEQ